MTDESDRSCDPAEETTSELEDRVEESASPGETRGGACEQRVKWRRRKRPHPRRSKVLRKHRELEGDAVDVCLAAWVTVFHNCWKLPMLRIALAE